ncbi:hypothetical protein QUF61_14185 [Candidatus Venteria ishoeyi]|uniref:hypothetical protein n=1 Tax=Candidatus Venteria ishoeyi TaxID=1899563 RepID=UPI0025A5E61D|nr:hypothetical protein [Candidatus Venteria ishoeyi]MDM8547636.1 hypothetical protein [Candidatus Venteria ishoeyi]
MPDITVVDSGFGGFDIAATLDEIVTTVDDQQIEKLSLYYVNAAPSDACGYNQMACHDEKARVFSSVLQNINEKITPKAIYIACNTLSALMQNLPRQKTAVHGIVDVGVKQLLGFSHHQPQNKIVLFATETTVDSGIYLQQMAAMGGDPGGLIAIAAPNLATTISNDPAGDKVLASIESLVAKHGSRLPPPPAHIALFLGCTHYGYRASLFRQVFAQRGYRVTLLNPNDAFAQLISQQLGEQVYRFSAHFFSRYMLPVQELTTISRLVQPRSVKVSRAILDYTLDVDFF